MYLVLRASMVFGIFSNKKYMKVAIENYIKEHYEKDGYHGWYHFRYIKLTLNQPWFDKEGKYRSDIAKALFSLSTMHTEYFKEIENDPSTGKLINF